MKKLILSALLLAASCLNANAAESQTVEVGVEGLNCTLCSDALKAKLKTLAGARDIEPRLECGKIYLEVPPDARLNERAVEAALRSNGFNYTGIKPASKSIAAVRKTAQGDC
jgi:copper chaperone CopZ